MLIGFLTLKYTKVMLNLRKQLKAKCSLGFVATSSMRGGALVYIPQGFVKSVRYFVFYDKNLQFHL